MTVAGLPAVELKGALSPSARTHPADGGYDRPFAAVPILPRNRVRFQVLTVRGQQVVVVTIANADGYRAFRPIADEIIATFSFAAP